MQAYWSVDQPLCQLTLTPPPRGEITYPKSINQIYVTMIYVVEIPNFLSDVYPYFCRFSSQNTISDGSIPFRMEKTANDIYGFDLKYFGVKTPKSP